MNILVINCGSSSVKYQLIDMTTEEPLTVGLVERVGLEGSVLEQKTPGHDEVVIKEDLKDHTEALKLVLDTIVDPEFGPIKSMEEIDAVGHRVVHGGEEFSKSVIIDEKVMKSLEDNVKLAPLHNPPNIQGIEAIKEVMPGVTNIAVFDTAFHQTMEPEAFIYAIPYELYEKHGIRRYGFHGTSHKYVTERAAELLEKDLDEVNLITCHLGNGSSLSAVRNGKSIDTSMGLTPLAGVSMGTRSGDIDPAIIPFLMEAENITAQEVDDILNKQSGAKGLSGISSDYRDLENAASEGNERAELALNQFMHTVKKYIGSYRALTPQLDAVIFTAGVGENSDVMRAGIIEGLEGLGMKIDPNKNDGFRSEGFIHAEDSDVKIIVIPTNEELMIAKESLELLS